MMLLTSFGNLFKPWGSLGILFAVASILLGALSVYIGGKIKSEGKLNLVILAFGACFLGMEIMHEVRRFIDLGGYDWSSFPFQISSVSMYLCFILQIVRKGRVRNAILSFMSLFTVLSGYLPIFFAQGNLLRWGTIQGVLFSFVWHILLAMVGLIVLGYRHMGKEFKVDKFRILEAITVFVIITCVAQLLNFTIHTFAGAWEMPAAGYKEAGYIENYELDPDSASLFYISPYFRSNISIGLADIWLKAGFVAAWVSYDLAFILLSCLVYLLSYGGFRLGGLRKREYSLEAKKLLSPKKNIRE